MSQISRLHEAQIANGNIINADDLNDEFNQLVNESNNQDTRLSTIESGNITLSGVKTFSSIPVLPATDPATENEAVRKAYVDSLKTYFESAVQGLIITPPPTYENTSTLSLGPFSVSGGNEMIVKSTPTTVNIASSGLNGTAQSDNLAGTVSVTSGSAAVNGTDTHFTTDFQVGDVIAVSGAQNRRITAIASDTSLMVESNFTATVSGANYKRGGEAPSTWYYLYAITDGITPGLILSTRNGAGGETLLDLPTGYEDTRQLPFAVRNDASANFLPWLVANGWPDRPLIKFTNLFLGHTNTPPATAVLNASSGATTYTDVDCSAFIPKIARIGYFNVLFSRAVTSYHYVRPNGVTSDVEGFMTTSDSSIAQRNLFMDTDASQVIEYKAGTTSVISAIAVAGFVITEVH